MDRLLCNLLFDCARAVSLAYFQTAEKSGALGARLEDVVRGLTSGSLEDWARFVALWPTAAPQTGGPDCPKLISGRDGVIHTMVRRDEFGLYREARVGVFRCVQMLVGDRVPPVALADWYTQNLRERRHISDSPEFLAFARNWLKRLKSHESRSVTRRAFLDDGAVDWSLGLLEALEYLHVLGFDKGDPSSYSRLMDATEDAVLAHLLGVSTGSQGLDYLLHGAMRIPPQRQTILITGEAGCGKSTLALGMAAQVAARGGTAVFFRLEIDEFLTLRQVSQFYGHVLPYLHLAPHKELPGPADNEPVPSTPEADGSGLLAIRRLPSASPADFMQACSLAISGLKDAAQEKLIVFDSLSALGQTPASLTRRAQFHLVTSTLRSLGFTVVCVMEQDTADGTAVEPFVADLVIHLASQHPTETHASARILEIRKSRHQACHSGTHRYEISADRGLDVTPASSAVIDTMASQGDRHYFSRQPIAIDVEGFADFFVPAGVKKPGDVSFWMTGSTSALIGPRGTLKTAFARQFCKAPTRDRSPETSLLVRFADKDRQAGRSIPRRDRNPQERAAAGYTVRIDSGDDASGAIYVLECFPGHVSSERILWAVHGILDDLKRQQTPIQRAAITDLANISAGFPVIHEDLGFLPALIATLASERITTALVYSTSNNELHDRGPSASDPTLEQIQALSENVLRFGRVWGTTRQRTSVRIERAADPRHDRGVYELRERTNRRLVILPSFDALVSVDEEKPQAVEIHLYLQAETAHQEKYCEEVRSVLVDNGRASVTFRNEPASIGFSRLRLNTAERAVSSIIALDNWELPYAGLGPAASSPLSPLKDLSRRFDAILPDLVRCPVRARGKRMVLTVPHFLNPPFLVARRDFYDALITIIPREALSNGCYQWSELLHAALALGVTGDNPVARQVELNPQDISCLFLEILSSIMATDLNRIASLNGVFREINQPGGQMAGNLVAAIRILRTVLGLAAQKDGSERPLLQRVWYSLYRTMSHPGIAIRLPGRRWTCGDWHLGILNNGLSARPALDIILHELVNPERPFHVVESGVGLPPFRSTYRTSFAPEFDDIGLSWFRDYIDGTGVIYRSMIPHYPSIAALLESYLRSLAAADLSEETFQDSVLAAFNSLIPLAEIASGNPSDE